MFDDRAVSPIGGQMNEAALSFGFDNKCQVIAVTSGKGGVGKTNLVVNVSVALRRAGQRVIILDADFGLANVDVFMGLNPTYHLGHVLQGSLPLSAIVQEGPEGVHLIPASSGIQELTNIDVHKRSEVLRQLDGILQGYDFLLIDTAAGISNNVINLLTVSSTVIIVCMPEPTAILDAYALIKVLVHRNRTPELFLVVNSAASGEEAQRVFERLSKIVKHFLGKSVSYLGFLPRDDKVSQALRRQVPVIVSYPSTRVSRCFTKITDSLLDRNPRFLSRELHLAGKA